jgi:DNA-binding Xre family transcriptional regulator
MDNPTAPDTGKMIDAYFSEKRIRKNALSRLMGKNISSILAFQKKPSIQTKTLWELCHALKYNFFADLAAELPETFGKKATSNEQAEKIAKLEQEIVMLTREKNLLLEALRKG